MARFRVSEEVLEGQLLVRLEDDFTGAEAVIVPTFGNNLMLLKLPAEGATLAVVDDLDRLDDLMDSPNRFGTPILFPWAGRVYGEGAMINGRLCNLTGADGTTHHGFVNRVPWRLVDTGRDEISCWATTELTSLDTASVSVDYDFEFRLRMTWVLTHKGLSMQVAVANIGDEPMPFGFGAHPFFRIPMEGSRAKRGDCVISFDAAGQWQMEPLQNPAESLQDELALLDREGFEPPTQLTLGNDMLNHVYQLRSEENGEFVTELTDPGVGLTMRLTSSEGFRTLVLFTPDDRDVVAIEPWTSPPNAFNLDAALMSESDDQDLESDLLTIPPGGRWDGEIRFELRASDGGN